MEKGQTSLPDRQAGRYLKYAIGEILLVVIGILIALQINNWNTERIEKKELHNYLNTIADNIESDKIQIETMDAFRDSVKVYSSRIMEVSQQERIMAAELQLVTHDEYNIFYDQYLELNTSGFEALKNSGYLGKIQGTQIDKLLNEYYRLMKSVGNQEKSLNDFIENMEVLGFEDKVFTRLIEIFRKPDFESYLEKNQAEIKELINHPSIVGANLRGSLVTGLMRRYAELIRLGEEIRNEINNITQKEE